MADIDLEFATAVGALIKGRSPVGHSHDDRYYTKAEVDARSHYRGVVVDTADTLFGSASRGLWSVNSTAITGLPIARLGQLEVIFNPSSARTTQIFTVAQPGPVRQYSRVRSGGAWGAWEGYGWARGALGLSDDFDTIRSVGAYPVEGTSQPNQPVPSVGTLEVLPSSGRVLQRFTTWDNTPTQYVRRSITDTSWNPWNRNPTAADMDALDAAVQAQIAKIAPVPRAPLEARPAVATPISSGFTVGAMSKDRAIVWTSVATTLKYSLDDGETWIDKHTFGGTAVESTLVLDNGELLVTGSVGARERRVVWVSEGLLTPDEVWNEVLEAPYWGIKFTQTWSQATYGRIVLLNEYGPKAGTSWGSVPLIPEGEGATRVYLSLDYGRTWRIIFNLADYVVQQHGRPNGDLQHLHGVEWDPYWDRIWISWGDSLGGVGTNGIAYSDDLGATWETAYTSLDHTPSTQVVGIKAMPQCVLFFGDMGDDVSRIDRTEGRDGPYTLVPAFVALDDGKYLCQGHYQGQREGGDAPLLAAFATEGAAGRDYLVATMDGYAFEVVWRNPDVIGGGRGLRHPVGPSIRGQFLAATNAVDGTTGNWAQLRIPATGY